MLKRADLVSAINENNRDYALANGARQAVIIPISGQISPIHLTDPAEREGSDAAIKSLGLPAGRPFLLYFGRLIDLKHPDDALRAMAQVIEERPGTVGVIGGEGDMEPRLKSLAEELGVANSIRFPGLLEQGELSRILPQAIVLSPSAGQMAVLESALGRAAIVAYDCDFQFEFIDDGRNGFLVPMRHWRALAERASLLLGDAELRRQISAAARSSALDHMAPERVREAEKAAFGQILSTGTGLG